jgi:fructose/tagatose bisphosphate aldolase
MENIQNEFLSLVKNSIEIQKNAVKVKNIEVFRTFARKLAEISALEKGSRQGFARWLIRAAALELGIYPASINELYLARGRGEVPFTFTVPAINLRVLSFDAAAKMFQTALKMNASAMIFEIARSEMGYTDQKPAEYASSILAAAISEGYVGPVFIQGDHFQISSKKYLADPNLEINALKGLIVEAIQAGFYNIDIDSSTMVDLTKKTIDEQQKLNIELTALFSMFIRENQPKKIDISIGGEIGEVGGHNSTPEELHVYLNGYKKEIQKTKITGLSKISVQTGTSHGGVVLPDGSIAKVNVDFNTLRDLSRIARKEYGLGGTVQHGASTLPEDAFGKFVEYEAIEVHLATNFANMFFDLIPEDLKKDMYAYLREKNSADRKPDMTDEQFYYKTRKNVIGPFKSQSWKLDNKDLEIITKAWETQFIKLFNLLGLKDTRKWVEKYIKPEKISPKLSDFTGDFRKDGDTSDLAD